MPVTETSTKVKTTNSPKLIVGVGASAGGLAAFRELLSNTPNDAGIAYVLLPHLDPRHKSVMQELLADKTSMAVCQAEDGQLLVADQAYILPAGKGLNIIAGKLKLVELDNPHYQWTAVDQFLRSLAEDAAERAAAIILSGTGSQGTLGIRAIKQAGGLVLAQSPETSQYPQMPENAINSGMVDLILAAANMPAALIEYTRHPYMAEPSIEVDMAPELINPILNVLRSRTRFDFRHYRKNMIIRRIHRRMSLCHMDSVEEYQQYLRNSPEEISALNKDLLIGVTAFFRDPEAFHVLDQRVVAELVNSASEDSPVRVWVPACSTGEEAYTLAILLIEAFIAANKVPNVQIFATDIDESALAVARQGIYPASIVNDVTYTHLQRFLVKSGDDKYRVNQQLRDCVIFATQSLISDAPFSQLDLISCRNLMIYLLPEMQAKLIQLFHFSLKEQGYLLLGPSESIGRQSELFSVVSKKWKLFQRLTTSKQRLIDIPITGMKYPRSSPASTKSVTVPRDDSSLADTAMKSLLNAYAPATVVINRQYQILQFIGATTDYLQLPSGEPTHDLMVMLRKGLSSRVRAIAHRAWQQQLPVIDGNARVNREGHYVSCTLSARPIVDGKGVEPLMMISFEDRTDHAAVIMEDSQTAESIEEQKIVDQLEYELKATREDLQSNLEELESSNEELKAANEEMVSMNEELQSANEELETSKEELQSMNEELNTVNVELQCKVEELESSNDDISNLLASTDIATIFLDRSMNIKLFNPPTVELLHLRNSDIDRPIIDFSGRITNEHFITDAQKVLDKLATVERTITSDDSPERNYLRRMVPYRASNDRIGGVVVTYIDITERYLLEKKLEQRVAERTGQLQHNKQQLSLVLQASRSAVWEMTTAKQRQWLREESHSSLFTDPAEVGHQSWQAWLKKIHPAERQLVEQSLLQAMSGKDDQWEYQYRFETANGEHHWVSDIAHITRAQDGSFQRITGAMIDINDRKTMELALQEREQRLSSIMKYSGEGFIIINQHGSITEHNIAAEQIFDYDNGEMQGLSIEQLIPPRLQNLAQNFKSRLLADDSALLNRSTELTGLTKTQRLIPLDIIITKVEQFDLFVVLVRDLSDQQQLKQELSNISNWEQERTGRELHDGLGQRLTGMTMLAVHIKNRFSQQEPKETELLEEIILQLKEAAEEVSQISHGLAPISITPDGLADALTRLVELAVPSNQLRCQFECVTPISINDQSAAHQLYRIAQEALNNALKYAGATEIKLSLESIDGVAKMCIKDNGRGMELPQQLEQKGFGIRIMRYRANSIGATLTIDSSPQLGTEICCYYRYQDFPDS
jgi:two-component system CheB/CheR fusion protein